MFEIDEYLVYLSLKLAKLILTVSALILEMSYSHPSMVPVFYVDFQQTHLSLTDMWLFQT